MPAPLLKRGLWILAVAAGLLLLVVFALPYAASTRLVGDRIAHEMSEWSGLDVRLGAAPRIAIWPGLRADLTDVTLAVPGGGVVLTAGRVEVELSAIAAIGGDIDFTHARFVDPTLRIEEKGLPAAMPREGRIARALETARAIVAENRTAPDSSRLPADDFGVVEFSNGRIVSVTDGAEIASGLAGDIGWKMLNGRATATASGLLRGEQFALELSTASPLLLFGGAATLLKLDVKSAPVDLSFDGAASLGDNRYAEGRVSFSAPSVRRLLNWSNADTPAEPALGAIAVESRVMGDFARVRFEEAAITLDGRQAHGGLDLLLNGKLPKVSGTLAFDTLDLGAFLSAFTPFDPAAGDGPGVIDADFARRLNLDLRLSAAQATAGAISLSGLAATARVDEGFAAFDISDASALGGSVQAGLRFDRKATGAPVEMRLLASDIDGGALGQATGLTRLMPKGRGTVSVILKGEGESWHELMARANGSISATFGEGGLSGIDVDGLVARAQEGAPFRLDEMAGDGSPIDGFELKAAVTDGMARIEKAQIRSPLHRIALSGTAPLGKGDLNLSGRAEPPPRANAGSAEPGAAGLGATTFAIAGPWSAALVTPTVALDE